ncbi:hypothetical protein [Vibrio phage vB_ValS_PJ32]|nr:hypothetical protein [Vibrio phage vB_ValS_PJ32]
MQIELMGQLIALAPISEDEIEKGAFYLALLDHTTSQSLDVVEAHVDKNGVFYYRAGYEPEIHPEDVTPVLKLVGAKLLDPNSKETNLIQKAIRES